MENILKFRRKNDELYQSKYGDILLSANSMPKLPNYAGKLFWKYDESDVVIVDFGRTIDHLKKNKKSEIKVAKKANQDEDFPWDGNVFCGGEDKLFDYDGSIRLAVSRGKTEGEIFDIDDRPVLFDLDGATAMTSALGVKIWMCKKMETVFAEIIDSATTIEEVEAVAWEHVE